MDSPAPLRNYLQLLIQFNTRTSLSLENTIIHSKVISIYFKIVLLKLNTLNVNDAV